MYLHIFSQNDCIYLSSWKYWYNFLLEALYKMIPTDYTGKCNKGSAYYLQSSIIHCIRS